MDTKVTSEPKSLPHVATKSMAMWLVGLFTLIAAGLSLSFGQQVPDEKWGYVTVRPDAHMFWWLYGSTASDRDTRPLVMWLQVNTQLLQRLPVMRP